MIDFFYTSIIFIKSAAFLYLFDPDINLEWVPFLNNKMQDNFNVKEAGFFITNSLDPYLTDHIYQYQKPLLIYFLHYLRQGIFYKYYFLIADLLLGHLFATNLISSQKGYQRALRIFYHVNPITFFSLLSLNTDTIEYLLVLYSLCLIVKSNSNLFFSAIFFASGIYLNPQYFILISVIFVALRKHAFNQNFKFYRNIIIFLILFVISICILLLTSFYLTNSWLFLQKCYIDVYFPKNYYPTLGFIWALFSGLFTRYKTMYYSLYMIFPLCFIIPFYALFMKYGVTKKNQELQYFFGYMTGCLMFSAFLFFHQVTIMHIFIQFALIEQRYDIIWQNKIEIILSVTPSFIAIMAYGLDLAWVNGLTGNPNFLFFQCFVFYLFCVVIVSESLKDFLKQAKLKGLK